MHVECYQFYYIYIKIRDFKKNIGIDFMVKKIYNVNKSMVIEHEKQIKMSIRTVMREVK